MLRCLLLFIVVLNASLSGSGQDPLKRMDPDEWLALTKVQAMLEWADEHKEAFWMDVRSDAGQLKSPCGTESDWMLRQGDLRVVLTPEHVNVSRSHNLGFNLDAKSVVYNGRILSLGGRGFWNGHAKLIEFVEKSGEWEWVMTEENGPECVIGKSSWFNSETAQVFSIDEGAWGRSNEIGPNEVWCLDLAASSWEPAGRVNPKMELFVHGLGQLIDLEDYFVWPGLHKSAIVRKSDLETVFTTAWNYAELKDAMREAKKDAFWMTMTTGNHHRLLSLDGRGQESEWLEWDVEAAFVEAWEQGDSSPWLVPLEAEGEVIKTEAVKDAQANIPTALWAGVVLMVAGISFGAGRRGVKRRIVSSTANGVSQEANVADAADEVPSKDEGHSTAKVILTLISNLEEAGGRIMSTDELNDFLRLGQDVSSESKRAKRAQFIRDVNRVYQMRHGKEMIVREKDLNDRRRTIYVIHPCSDIA